MFADETPNVCLGVMFRDTDHNLYAVWLEFLFRLANHVGDLAESKLDEEPSADNAPTRGVLDQNL